MSVNTPPNPNVSTFNPLYWIVDEVNLTGYLKFPTGQGTETLPDLIVSGTTSLTGATTSSALITTTDLRINDTEIHLGTNAGLTNQGINCVAIGNGAGQTNQGGATGDAVAIGDGAGQTNQGGGSVAIGNNSVCTGDNSVAIGPAASSAGSSSVAIGVSATTPNTGCYALGTSANTSTFIDSVAIGNLATCTANNQIRLGTATESVSHPGTTSLTGATTATALITANGGLTTGGASTLTSAGTTTLTGATTSSALITTTDLRINDTALHLGTNAGLTSQGASSIAIGSGAGQTSLGANSIAIGLNSAGTGTSSIAIGNAATTSTFASSVAIGASATSTAANQITLGTTTSNYRLAGIYANNWVSYQNTSQVIPANAMTALLLTTTNNAGNCGITYNSGTGVFTNSNAYSVVCSISLVAFFPATASGRRIIQIVTSATGSRTYGAVEQVAGGTVANDSVPTSVNLVLATGQTFTPQVLQDTSPPISITIGRANNPNDLSMIVW